MSIYQTLWEIKIPKSGIDPNDPDDWTEVYAQAVPPWIDDSGETWDWLPPPVPNSDTGEIKDYRAVFICWEGTTKATERNGQEYVDPLFMFSGSAYAAIPFHDLLTRIEEEIATRFHDYLPEGYESETVVHEDGTEIQIIRPKKAE